MKSSEQNKNLNENNKEDENIKESVDGYGNLNIKNKKEEQSIYSDEEYEDEKNNMYGDEEKKILLMGRKYINKEDEKVFIHLL